MSRSRLAVLPLLPFLLTLPFGSVAGCGDSEVALDLRFEARGPHPVGNTTIAVDDQARDRHLTVELWYPATADAAAASEAGEDVTAMVADGADRDSYAALLASAPAGCPTAHTHSARDAEPLDAPSFPLVIFSHCHNCVRFSGLSIGERLASHGFVVAAPDHAGNTLFDDLAGTGVELDAEFLPVRAADIRFVLDRLLDPDAVELPAALRGRLDPDRVGVFGHSFGAVTAGMVLQDDPRPIAGFALASPMENPLLEGVLVANLEDPIGFLVAVEDNSITEIGNMFIRRNFDDAPVPAWKGEVSDAGHWSFSDICGLTDQFAACCGAGVRQTDSTDFEYLPIATGRAVAQAYVTAFFTARLLDDPSGRRYLEEARPAELVAVEQHD